MPYDLVIHSTTLPSEAKYPVSKFEWGEIKGRKIGPPKIGPASNPVSFWGANLSADCDLEQLKKMVDIAANTINTRFSGYILKKGGHFCYHIGLLPRRIDENPELLENFERKYQVLVTASSIWKNRKKIFLQKFLRKRKERIPKLEQ